jgi:hypothetical protein
LIRYKVPGNTSKKRQESMLKIANSLETSKGIGGP